MSAAQGGAPLEDVGAPAAQVDAALLADLVVANRILYQHGVVDAFGHVSVRHDKDSARFLLARNMAPGLVSAEDIVEFNLDGSPVDARGRRVYLERFIHGEIYRLRPDVQCVIHSHAPAVIPFTVVPGVTLQPIWHMSGFLGRGTPVFEIRDTAGEGSDLLISSNALGEALGTTLGNADVVLMRGHGLTIVGEDLYRAVFRAVYTQMNAELQARAMALGPVTYLTAGETEATVRTVIGQVERAWNLWKQQAEAGG